MDTIHASGLCAVDIVKSIVDKHALARGDFRAFTKQSENLCARLGDALAPRNHKRSENLGQPRLNLQTLGPGFRRPVGDAVDGHTTIYQPIDQPPCPWDRIQSLSSLFVPGDLMA